MNYLNTFIRRYFGRLENIFIIVIIGGLFVRLQKMNSIPFHDWDESIYARLAKEGLNHLFFPQYLSSPWLEKPPLPIFVWQYLVSFENPEFLLRTTSFLISIGIVLIVLKIINKFITDSKTSNIQSILTSLVGLSILTSSNLFIDRSSLVNVDLFLILSILGYFHFHKNALYSSIFIFIGVMSKSILGFFPILVELIFILISKNSKKLKVFARRLPVVVIPSLLWFVLAYLRYGQLFINEHFRDHLFLRLVQPIELHFGGRLFYLLEIQKDFGVMSLLIVVLLFCTLVILFLNFKRFETQTYFRSEMLLIIFFAVGYLAFLTFSKSKLSWYIGPLIPLIAILSASFFTIIYKKNKNFSYLIFTIIFVIGLYRFSMNTFFWYPKLDDFADTTLLGKCIHKYHQNKLTSNPIRLLVSPTQRETAHVLEASKLNISTSFRYAGMPGLIYYAYPQSFEIFYKEENFIKSLSQFDFLVIHNSDLSLLNDKLNSNSICKNNDWNYLQIR